MSFNLSPLLIDDAVRAALAEDLGRAGDITTQAIIPARAAARAVIAARETGVVAGLPLARAAFRQMDSNIGVEAWLKDGAKAARGDIVARIEGPARAILSAERVALNYMGRLSGVASLTAQYAARIAHTKAKVCDTRKTTPLLRALEKYAVRCGGGANHRFGLDDAVLIKDNHIAVAGGVVPALRAAKRFVGHLVKIEIEVDTLGQLKDVLAEGADAVLLDNMKPADLRRAVEMVGGRMICEASGGVTLETVAEIAETGVDLISVGALTHSARVLDLGLDIEIA
ncbi:carboxylating nicotinate-nucleotide diphosphorylase [Methylocystis sp. MJC1]|jgi:nicotinate-nucleotide pyrophosphorylase (carboxylating)|uniref:carboxylating nicotinate-nucleotide diphosphorylase n=1 Tax=Methylocystis sp. MJC1 TaxID=2654282 RepID=UPI0013EC764D|nr:carboxylating nicotinate-nucleotide diphosphorylase [Methylocystis sp. MJC1]KAF2991708.1 putative nicotinate-nucleotide pyrophosphorylase [carboxylating] [Methylocystis sp. MJC1]MBU6527053.1 carboxylating nicotinate-nucleotide diphosphorylase [Methylocystis sp. MJC1]UZX13490.1 carboxylating nicotinate-nucleotide diphosphorylase [Methylocystis sp. MJC1]